MKTRPKPTTIVGYLRTSTDDQLLGIDAQRERLEQIAVEQGCKIVRTYVEHESGGDPTRPEVDRALRYARRTRSFLVVAKLDRLARDQQFLLKLVDSRVPVVFGDLPGLDFTTNAAARLSMMVMSAVAEFELRRVGERTREALRILKSQGKTLGTPANLKPADQQKGSAAAAKNRIALAVAEQSDIFELATQMQAEGRTLGQIAKFLNSEGYPTRLNGARGWQPIQVSRVLQRARPK